MLGAVLQVYPYLPRAQRGALPVIAVIATGPPEASASFAASS